MAKPTIPLPNGEPVFSTPISALNPPAGDWTGQVRLPAEAGEAGTGFSADMLNKN
ncbi:MAG TPA: hypothetical protein VFG46_16475 [Chryseolinea sp.]|nr:hypothetical protein [Chryseolinea sp.]